jgi:hypothetical protein
VSLSTDIIHFLGPGSVPVLVAGSVLAVFELGERLASQRAKDALSKWLVSFDIQKAKAVPDGTQQIFDRIFGKRHFTLRCFIRSSAFSLGAVGFIAVLLFLIDPKEFKRKLFVLPGNVFSPFSPLVDFLFWLAWSIVIDYVSLFKTRLILRIFTRLRRINATAAVPIMVIDYVVYVVIFCIGVTLLSLGTLAAARGEQGWTVLTGGFPFIVLNRAIDNFVIAPRAFGIYEMFFWVGLVPSIWMWLYVLALFVTRLLLRSEKLITWLRWGLDVEKNPFRSIGAVAAALAFIASVAIILVAAEVSRIRAAA